MNKKVFILLLIVISFSLIIYRVIINVIDNAVNDANMRGIDLYVSSINYSYTAYLYKNGKAPSSISELDIDISTEVDCEQEKIYANGKIELYNCTVDNSKTKYNYVDGKVERIK